MNSLSTTKMSSKGQIVIPEGIREQLGLSVGTQFVVVIGNQDTVILKIIQPPSVAEVESLLTGARLAAKKAGAKKTDIENVIKKVRADR